MKYIIMLVVSLGGIGFVYRLSTLMIQDVISRTKLWNMNRINVVKTLNCTSKDQICKNYNKLAILYSLVYRTNKPQFKTFIYTYRSVMKDIVVNMEVYHSDNNLYKHKQVLSECILLMLNNTVDIIETGKLEKLKTATDINTILSVLKHR